jgi:outer membrane receptor protein involved in Fe transport
VCPASYFTNSATAINALQAFSGVVPTSFRTSFGSGKFSGWGMYGGIYVQDTWKVSSRLTIGLGIRFDVNAEPFPTGGVDNNVCEPLTATVANVGTLQTQIRNYAVAHGGTFRAPAIQSDCTTANGGVIKSFPINPTGTHTQYVSPRLGFAYQITSDDFLAFQSADVPRQTQFELPLSF